MGDNGNGPDRVIEYTLMHKQQVPQIQHMGIQEPAAQQVPTRPFHKEHRAVPALRMNPLTTMTSTEKENLAQQYKVHEVMTPERQSSTQTFTF